MGGAGAFGVTGCIVASIANTSVVVHLILSQDGVQVCLAEDQSWGSR
jgi:hypothetical protein